MSTRWGGALLWLLGGWFVLTAGMGYIASANFRVVEPDGLRASADVFASLAEGEERRQALRYVASEINRHLFALYGWVNLACAVLSVGLWFLAGRPSRLVLGMLVACLAMAIPIAFYFPSALTELGREIDFLPRDPPPPEVVRFYDLHTIDVLLELAKLVLLPVAAAVLVLRGSRGDSSADSGTVLLGRPEGVARIP